MKKTITLLALTAILFDSARAQKFILNALWRDSVIVIDGDASDWSLPFPYFDSKSKLQYCIINDAKYIYLSVRTSDPKAQMKIMRAGMDVSFDAAGKKKEIGTVHFPLASNPKLDANPDITEVDQQVVEKPDVKKLKMDWSTAPRVIHTQGLKNIPAVIPESDSAKYGLWAEINWDRDDVMTYELRLPFSAFYHDLGSASDASHPIAITIKAQGMDLPMIPTNTAADVSGMAGTGGGGMNNSMNGQGQGMNGAMPNSMNNNSRPQTSSPQPTMAIPRQVVDMGLPLIVSIKVKLAFR